MGNVRSYQEPTQLTNIDNIVPESYEVPSLGYSEGSLGSNLTAVTPDLTSADRSPQGPVNEVEKDSQANEIKEAEALYQIIKRKCKTRANFTTHASPEKFVEVKGTAKNVCIVSLAPYFVYAN